MSRLEAWLVHVATVLVGGTGVVYAWMRYFVQPADPYAVINHPWQPSVQHLHVWVAPLLVFGAGVIWREHVWKHWRRGVRPRRASGISMMLNLVPMIASGYLIQTAVTPSWRTAWIAVHLATSGLWLLGWLAHLASPLLARRRRRAGNEAGNAAAGRPAPLGGLALLLAALLALGACRPGEPPPPAEESVRRVTVYSERDEAVIRPLLDRFAGLTGVEVALETGAPGELAAALAAGEMAPQGAAVFLSRDSAVLGRLAAAGRLVPLPAEATGAVPAEMADPEGRWVGLTARARLLAYAPDRLDAEALPAGLPALAERRFRGRVALAPGSRSFLVHLAAYRALHGPEALERLLAGLAANEPVLAEDSAGVLAAIRDGEADLGLVDHTVLVAPRRRPEAGEAPALEPAAAPEPQAHLLPGSDSSGFLDLAGVAALTEDPAAVELIRFLLTPEAQADLSRRTREYPLVADVPLPSATLPPLDDLDPPVVDFEAVAEAMEETRTGIETHFPG